MPNDTDGMQPASGHRHVGERRDVALGFIGTDTEFIVADMVCRAAAEGRNVQPDGETWDDDQASAVECFAIQLLEALGWLDPWKAGWIP